MSENVSSLLKIYYKKKKKGLFFVGFYNNFGFFKKKNSAFERKIAQKTKEIFGSKKAPLTGELAFAVGKRLRGLNTKKDGEAVLFKLVYGFNAFGDFYDFGRL